MSEFDLRREALALLVAGALDELMAQRGITQSDLADQSGVHRVTVNQSLKAARLLTLPTLQLLAHALDAEVVVEFRPRVNSITVATSLHPPTTAA